MTEALKPCPFCGSSDLLLRETGNHEYPWEVFCRGSEMRACDAAMWGETAERAAEEWNTRADLAVTRKEVDAMVAEAVAKERERCARIADLYADDIAPTGVAYHIRRVSAVIRQEETKDD